VSIKSVLREELENSLQMEKNTHGRSLPSRKEALSAGSSKAGSTTTSSTAKTGASARSTAARCRRRKSRSIEKPRSIGPGTASYCRRQGNRSAS